MNASVLGLGFTGGQTGGGGGSPTGPAGNDLGGSYPNPTVVAIHTGATQLTIGTLADGNLFKRSGTTVAAAIADTDYATPGGVVSYVTGYAVPLTAQVIAGTGLAGGGAFSGGNLTLSLPAVGPGSGTIGTAGIATITLDAQGRVTAASTATYVPTSTQVIAGTGLSGGGSLTGNVTLSLPAVGPGAGTIGGSGIASITLDAQGRVTSAATATYLTSAAPVGAQYLTLATDATLTAERVLTISTGLTAVDAGANSTYTITNNLSTGVSGGQSVIGGTGSGENLTLSSTANATKGQIILGSTSGVVFDGVHNRLGIGAASSSESLEIHGGAVAFTGTAGFNGSGTGIYGQSASAFLGFVVAGSEVARIDGTAGNNLVWKGGSFLLGNSAIATNATDGFPYIRGGSGAPTGVPTSHTGVYALYWDHTNKKLYIYDGAWLGGTAPGVWS